MKNKKVWGKPTAQKIAVAKITKGGWYQCSIENCWAYCTGQAS